MSSTFEKEETSDMDVHVDPEAEITGDEEAAGRILYIFLKNNVYLLFFRFGLFTQ